MDASRSTTRSAHSVLLQAPLLILSLAGALMLVCDIWGQRRPGKHQEFSDGFRAYKQEDWEAMADRMLLALVAWDEDGELTRVYGRWFEPYLPRYYLGVALYELGCYELSLSQLNTSILSAQEIKGAKKQLEELESIKLKSDRFVREGVIQNEDSECAAWNSRINQLKPEEGQ